MSDDSEKPKCASSRAQVLWFVDFLKLTVDVYVFDDANKVRQRLVCATTAMTDWSIRSAKRNFDHDDIDRQRILLVLNAPSSESLIGDCSSDTNERVLWVQWLAGSDTDALKLVGFGLRKR